MANKKRERKDEKLFAFLAVFLSIIGFLIALIAKRDDKYVMFYAKESLVLFIVAVILNIAGKVISFITLGILSSISYFIGLILIILWIVQIVYSISGQEKSTPFIGQYAKKINL